MSEKNKPAQGLDPKSVKGSCFARPLPDKLPCGCKTDDVTAVGEGFQCECGCLWKVGIVEDVPEPEFKKGDSVQVGRGGGPYQWQTGVVLGALTRTPGEGRQYVVELTSLNRRLRLVFAEHELEVVDEEKP